MALQLGYTSVATDRVHSGSTADCDRSTGKPLDVSSVLSAAPGIAESAKFHQKLLDVAAEQPFRQYSWITVVVKDANQALALSSGNQVLRTYDVVAARPTNQRAIEQACENLGESSIFEISYGRALFDARSRKELFANAQVLQTATKGHGVVISSGAFQTVELRDLTMLQTWLHFLVSQWRWPKLQSPKIVNKIIFLLIF